MHNRRRSAPAVLALTALLAVVAGCENSPLQTDDDHPVVNGASLIRNGQVLVRASDASGVQGQIQVGAGGTLGVVAVVFDLNGQSVSLDGDEYLEIAVTNPSVATFEPSSPRASNGNFRGLAAGSTTFRVRLLHGSPGHTDWLSPALPLVVTP